VIDLQAKPRQSFLGFDHIDTRVPSLAKVEAFYDALMPLVGLTRKKRSFVEKDIWSEPLPDGTYNTAEYFTPPSSERPFFIGIIERAGTPPTLTRIALRVENAADPEWLATLRELGALKIEFSEDMSAYPAIFFEDPGGTKLEIVSRRSS